MCQFMRRIQACVLILLSCLIARSSFALNILESSCLPNCQCSIDTLECHDVEFSRINISLNISTVKLTRVQISKLNTSSIGNPKKLRNLVLNHDEVTHIDFNFFKNFHQIEVLNLANNEIQALDNEIFNQLAVLKTVIFKSNYIKKLDDALFYKLEKLETVDFSNNLIETPIKRCMLRDLTELQYLDLSKNKIKDVDSDALEKNEYLQYVNLSHNNLEDVKTIFEDLTHLGELDLSHNQIRALDKNVFEDCSGMKKLFLNHNRLEYLPLLVFQYLENLEELKLNNNPLKHLPTDIFHQNRHIQIVDISNLKIIHLRRELLQDLKDLKKIEISNNTFLQSIDDGIFLNKPELSFVNLGFTNISRIPVSLLTLDKLKHFSLENLKIHCDCRSTWFLKSWAKISNSAQVKYDNFKCVETKDLSVVEVLKNLSCKAPEVIYNSPITHYMLLTPAVLDCVAVGNPDPEITWFTPNGITFHDSKFNSTGHPRVHNNKLEEQVINTMKVMENGSLYIQHVTREDAGNYTCFVLNKNSNSSAVIIVRLDPDTFNNRQFMSLAVGIFCALMFLVGTVVTHAIIFICKKICVKNKGESPKTDIHQMIEAAEQYRTQQLEKLRENYMSQITKIEEDCAEQTKWIWESYHGQVKDSKDMKDNGASHLSSIKEQYNDQVRKVRDYTTSQLNRVRENYVFQRDKIRKFSAHQMLRFRENCKYQQQALNKVFENFNIDNCKNGCGQSSSEINFNSHDDRNTNENAEDQQESGTSLPIDKLLSSCDESDIKLDEKICPILKCYEMGSTFSIYYTPTETTNSPITPRFLNQKPDENHGQKLSYLADGDKLLPLLATRTDDIPSLQIELKSRRNSAASIQLLETSLDLDQNRLVLGHNQTLDTNQTLGNTTQNCQDHTEPGITTIVFKAGVKNGDENDTSA